MHLSDDPDPWDRILQRKAQDAPVIVQAREANTKTVNIILGIALLFAAFALASTKGDTQ